MRRSVVVLALVIVCAVGVSACGDDDDGGESSQSSSTTAASTQSTGQGGRFCELFRSYNDQFSRTSTIRDSGELRDLLRSARSDVEEAKDLAPPEIKADTEVVYRVIDDYVGALEDVDFNASRIPVDLAQRLASPDFLNAAQRTQAYVATNCG